MLTARIQWQLWMVMDVLHVFPYREPELPPFFGLSFRALYTVVKMIGDRSDPLG